ncbi:plasmid segregation oscillating ATPase ParF [Humitalea rosea]|uniref:Plasmid segregation oscillating ATPase ParF n=1 Tax=Humitalea rosea TaxID=990373 RepID=A0A2W7IVK6_9PROT|nr:ParA family partition ATPase [Humitalea rosea]PZW50798.1 plasmid segregation oscillating ATPase ParF [Humitalea rosea]
MAFIIAVAQRKGGAGKSTIAANLAAALAASGEMVTVLDIDPQASLSRWHAERLANASPRAARLVFDAPSGWRVGQVVDRLKRVPGWVILDTPPHAEADARNAIRAADLVLVPLQPSAADLWAMDATLELTVAERRPVVVMLNRLPASGKLKDQVSAEVARRGLPLLPGAFGNRTAFAAAFALGLGAIEHAPRGAAADEARALAEAIRREAT